MQAHYAQVTGGSMHQAGTANRRRTDFSRDRRTADVLLVTWSAHRPERRKNYPTHERRWERWAGHPAKSQQPENVTTPAAARMQVGAVTRAGRWLYEYPQYNAAVVEADDLRHAVVTWKDDSYGVTSLEYGLLAALITIVFIAGFSLLDSRISTTMSTIGNALPSG